MSGCRPALLLSRSDPSLIAPVEKRATLTDLTSHAFLCKEHPLVPVTEIELDSANNSLEASSITFPALDSTSTSFTAPIVPVNTKWIGWSWYPERVKSLAPITPVRPSERGTRTPSVPKSTQKRRAVSQSQAYRQLLSCIGLSARKGVNAPRHQSAQSTARQEAQREAPGETQPVTVDVLEQWHSREEVELSVSRLQSAQSDRHSPQALSERLRRLTESVKIV